MTSLAAAKSGSASANTFAVARRLDALAIATLVVVAVIAAFTFRDYGLGWDDYTHSQYGSLLVSLYKSGFADKRALSFVNLYMYGGGFDLLATLSAKILPFGPVRDAPVGRRRGRPRRPFRHLAAGAPSRRPARRFDRASTARRLPALLRSHVHEREGHALRGGHGDRAARHRARVRRISARDAGDRRAVRHRHRPRHRIARHGRLCADQCAAAAPAHPRSQIARERPEIRSLRMGLLPRAVHSGRHPRLSDHGPGLAVGRRVAAQSVSRRRILFQSFSKSRGANCSTAN